MAGIDDNKKIKDRKRHVITDMLSVVHAANKANMVLAPLKELSTLYIETILANAAYEKVFMECGR